MTVDELERYGLEHMDDEEISGFLSNQKVGILGLQGEDVPYLLPISYGYDGESSLYMTYVTGSSSRKATLTDRTETGRFLVYNASSMFVWESVILTGGLREVPETEWDELDELLEGVWHPEVFESAKESGGVDVSVYEFRIDDRVGIKHVGLPSGFEDRRDEAGSD